MKALGLVPRFFRGVIEEGRKVVWPTRAETINITLVVLATIAVAMLIIGAVDFGLSRLVQWVIVGRLQ